MDKILLNKENTIVEDCSSVEQFLKRYHKRAAGDGRLERMILYYTEDLEKFGYCFISRHDSITGRVVIYAETII